MKILQTISFGDLDKWYVSYYLNPHTIESNHSLVKLSEIIYPRKDRISKDEYKNDTSVIRKISFKDGKIHLRDENKTGMDLYRISKGELLVSKINFHQGAISINEIGNLVCSTHYQPYQINEKLITKKFLALCLRSDGFLNFVKYLRADGIKNEATYEFIGKLKIPLPSLEEQNKIVANYNTKIQLAKQQEKQAEQLELDIESYLFEVLGIEKSQKREKKKGLDTICYSKLSKWALSHFYKDAIFDVNSGNFKTLQFKELIEFFKGGKTPSKQNKDYWTEGDMSWTSPKDFNNLFIEKSEDHISEKAVIETSIEVFPKGTILSVFRSGILRHSFPTSITTIETTINQDLKAYKLREEIIIDFYYLYFITVFKKYVLINASKKSVTVESINTEEFMELDIPVPPLEIQNEIILKIGDLKQQIKDLKRQAKQNQTKAIKEFELEIFTTA